MVNYQSAEGHYPPAAITSKDGKPLLSWRVAILPYFTGGYGHNLGDLHKDFHLDEPWDSPHNKQFLDKMPAVFVSPTDRSGKATTTPYRVFAGNVSRPVEPGVEPSVGAQTMFRVNRGTGIQEITDGTNNTIMVVEAAQAVPWTKPEELPYLESKPLPRLGGSMKDGFAALFASGLVRFLDRNLDEQNTPCADHVQRRRGCGGGSFALSRLNPPPGDFRLQRQAKLADSLPGFPQRYAGAKTLGNALGILKDTVEPRGEKRVRRPVDRGKGPPDDRCRLESSTRTTCGARANLKRNGTSSRSSNPTLEQIALQGSWPADCWFTTTDETRSSRRDYLRPSPGEPQYRVAGSRQAFRVHRADA